MNGNKQILSILNEVLTSELTSINQYFLHARMCKNWGFTQLDKKAYKKSIQDMKQADALIERILFLQGLPNLQMLNKLFIGEDALETLSCDLRFQEAQIPTLKKAIYACEQEKDYVSRALLCSILNDEEEYLDWLETQQHQIHEMGKQNYLQSVAKGE